MALPDTSAIANAVIAKLGADATLLALVPNGVHWGEAPAGSTRFVIVSLADAHDIITFRGRTIESALFSVEARMLVSAGGNIQAAAARIDALLEDQPLTVAGYTWMSTLRESPSRPAPEIDAVDTSIRWNRRGGMYRVEMSIT